MSMLSIKSLDPAGLADLLHTGLFKEFKSALRKRLMTDLEMEVDHAIEDVVENFKGKISAEYDLMSQKPTFHIQINHKDALKSTQRIL